MPEHLELPFIPVSLQRPTSPGFGKKRVQRNAEEKQEFYRTSIEKFSTFESTQEEKKRRFPDVYNPNLIFKISLSDKENESAFREELLKSNIQILSPAPEKSGYWVAFSEENDLHSFKARFNKYATGEPKYDVFNGITGFDFIPHDDKIGKRFREVVLQNDERIYVDVE